MCTNVTVAVICPDSKHVSSVSVCDDRRAPSLTSPVVLTMKTSSLLQQGEEINSAQLKFRMCFSHFQWCHSSLTVFVFALQSGSGGGVGAAAGAAGPTREGQRVLGAPGPGHHCPLLGHQHNQGFCRRLDGQGHLPPSRILETGQGWHRLHH